MQITVYDPTEPFEMDAGIPDPPKQSTVGEIIETINAYLALVDGYTAKGATALAMEHARAAYSEWLRFGTVVETYCDFTTGPRVLACAERFGLLPPEQ